MSLIVAPDTVEFFPQAKPGKVEQIITSNRQGRVQFMGTSWFAQFHQPNGKELALPGTFVKVIGRQGLTLLVVSIGNDGVRPQMLIGGSKANQSVILRFIQQMGSAFANLLN
ncbi:MAG: hypothetical protein HC878_09690 [Leptolyngbyaceae cyanobacterium SL_5_14]|nr:hypothetical protein [Leptolyngbyaceae cyanobacterium SL_5_14]